MQFSIYLGIIGICLVLLLCVGMKIHFKDFINQPLSLDATKTILGFCAILIVLHHISQSFNPMLDLGFMELVGVPCVALFMVFSAYGLVVSFESKENYLDHFFSKRVLKIVIPFLIMNIVYIVYYHITDWKEILMYFVGIRLINGDMWYVVTIIILYTLFYLCYKYIEDSSVSIFLITLFCIGYALCGMYIGHGDGSHFLQGEWWYNTCLMFPLGLCIGTYRDSIFYFFKKYYPIVFVAMFILVIYAFRYENYALSHFSYWREYWGVSYQDVVANRFYCYIAQTLMEIVFTFFILVLTLKVEFHNPLLKFLQPYSYELYMTHRLFLKLARSEYLYIHNDYVFILFVVLAGIGSAVMLHYASTKLYKAITTKKEQINLKVVSK